MKQTFGAIAVFAALAFGGGIVSTPALAQTTKTVATTSTLAAGQAAVSATDMSARRYYRRYGVVRPFPIYPYSYPYAYRRPVVYPNAYNPYPYAYYRPRPVYYRPYPYYAPAPFFRIGIGPRYWW